MLFRSESLPAHAPGVMKTKAAGKKGGHQGNGGVRPPDEDGKTLQSLAPGSSPAFFEVQQWQPERFSDGFFQAWEIYQSDALRQTGRPPVYRMTQDRGPSGFWAGGPSWGPAPRPPGFTAFAPLPRCFLKGFSDKAPRGPAPTQDQAALSKTSHLFHCTATARSKPGRAKKGGSSR